MSTGLVPHALPAVTPEAPGGGIERPPKGSSVRVLLVESDPGLRRWYRQALGDAGYRVDDAPGGDQALERLRREPAPDAMVLEVELADMSGIELLRRALALHPSLAVVFNTKCAAFKAHFGTWGADRFVVKSSDLGELKAALIEVLTH